MKEVILIIAAAASGKSTFVEGLPSEVLTFPHPWVEDDTNKITINGSATAKSCFADGDDLIGAVIGWPTQDDWFRGGHADYAQAINMRSVFAMVERLDWNNRDKFYIFWNAAIWPYDPIFELYGEGWKQHKVTFVAVEIPEAQHREYQRHRAAEGKYPRTWRDAHNNRNAIRSEMISLKGSPHIRFHPTVFESFEEAVANFETDNN